MSNLHVVLGGENQESFIVAGRTYLRPAIPVPFFTTKGLPLWKRFNQDNWRPQCDCGEIFGSLAEYREHYYREVDES